MRNVKKFFFWDWPMALVIGKSVIIRDLSDELLLGRTQKGPEPQRFAACTELQGRGIL